MIEDKDLIKNIESAIITVLCSNDHQANFGFDISNTEKLIDDLVHEIWTQKRHVFDMFYKEE